MTAPDTDRSADQRLRELAISNELMRSLTSTLDLPAVLRLILARVKLLTQAEGLSFLLYDQEREDLVFAVAETLQRDTLIGRQIPIKECGAVGWVVERGRSLLFQDAADDSRFRAIASLVPNFVTRGVIVVPLRRDGEIFGVLEVVNRYDGLSFTAGDLDSIERAADTIGATLVAGRGNQARERQSLLAQVVMAVPAECVTLSIVDRASWTLAVQASRIVASGLVAGMRLRLDQGIAGWVARERQAVRLDDAAGDPRHDRGIESQTHLVPRTMLCVPVLSRTGVLGVIQVINKLDGEPFTDNDLRMAQTLADHAALAIANLCLYRQAQLASITDDLTDLGNTRHFNQVLPEILAQQPCVSLLVLDLDNFKAVVDTHGHLVGSRTIREIGHLIGKLIRPGDVAARFGGDEFVVILPATDTSAAGVVAETLRAAIAAIQTLEPDGIDINSVTASVGVASFPEHATNAEELFKAADAAMYRVKRASKNSVGVANPKRLAALHDNSETGSSPAGRG